MNDVRWWSCFSFPLTPLSVSNPRFEVQVVFFQFLVTYTYIYILYIFIYTYRTEPFKFPFGAVKKDKNWSVVWRSFAAVIGEKL